jgi:hypothetical protein
MPELFVLLLLLIFLFLHNQSRTVLSYTSPVFCPSFFTTNSSMMKHILCMVVVLMAVCAPAMAYHKGVKYFDLSPSKNGDFELSASATESADASYTSSPISMQTISPRNTGASVASVPRANMMASFPSNIGAAAAAAPKPAPKPAAPSATPASSTASATGGAASATGTAGFNHGKTGGQLPTNLQFMFF